jgi:hypothetical protein
MVPRLRLELLKFSRMWDSYPSVADWWPRMRGRPSVKTAVFDRVTQADAAPFTNLPPDPWPKSTGVAYRTDPRNAD